MESNFKKLFSSVNGGRAVNSTNKLGQNRRQFTPTRSMPPDTVQLSQAQGGLGENVRLTKKKIGLSRNYKNRNTIAAFDGSKVISADTIGNLAKKEFKDSNKFTRKFILQFLFTKLGKCQNDDSKLTNLILSIKNTVTTKGNLAATTNDDIKLALTFLNKILDGAKEHNETISTNMMETLEAFSEVDKISVETKNEINKQKQAVISKQIELALNTEDEDVIANTINQLGVLALDPETTELAIQELVVLAQNPKTGDLAINELGYIGQNTKDETVLSNVINGLGDIAQNSGDKNVISNVMTQLVNIAQNPEAGEQVINKIGDIAQNSKVDTRIRKIAITQFRVIAQNSKVDTNTRDLARGALRNSALDPDTREQAIQELGVLAQNPETSEQAIQELVVLALDSETTEQAINELVNMAQNTKDETVLSNVINGLGDIAQNSVDDNDIRNVMIQLVNIAQNPEAREQVINKLGVLAQNDNPTIQNSATSALISQDYITRESYMDDLKTLAQNTETDDLAINQLGVLAQNDVREIRRSAIMQFTFIVQDPGIVKETKEKAINKLGDIAQDPTVDQETRDFAIRQLGVCARNDKTSEKVISKQVINKLGDIIIRTPKVDHETRNSAINKFGDIAQDLKVDQKVRNSAINKLGAIAQDPTVDQEAKEKAINGLGAIARNTTVDQETRNSAINKLGDIAQDPTVDQETRDLAIRQLSVCARNPEAREQVINKLGDIIIRTPKVDQKTKEKAINGLGAIAQDPKVDHETRNSAINKLGDIIIRTPKVDQETKDFVIRQLGAIAKSKEYYQSIALQKLSAIAQRDILTLEKKTTTIESVVSILKDVAQMYPASVKNKLEFLTQNIQACKTDQDIKDNKTVSELLEFINSAINDIDKEYPNAKEIENKNIEENNKKKASLQQNS